MSDFAAIRARLACEREHGRAEQGRGTGGGIDAPPVGGGRGPAASFTLGRRGTPGEADNKPGPPRRSEGGPGSVDPSGKGEHTETSLCVACVTKAQVGHSR